MTTNSSNGRGGDLGMAYVARCEGAQFLAPGREPVQKVEPSRNIWQDRCKMPKLYGLMIVRDEADIVEQTILHAAKYCEKIIIIDNMSIDGTWDIISSLAAEYSGRVVALTRTAEAFRDGLRAIAYNAFHEELSAADWWLRLDADEFLHEDPANLMERAAREGADFIRANMINFALTDVDMRGIEDGTDSRSTPIEQRRRYYRVDWREFRLFRNDPNVKWDTNADEYFPQNLSLARTCSKNIFVRHYSQRDPIQIGRRLAVRVDSKPFMHVGEQDWRTHVFPSTRYHYFSGAEKIKYNPFIDFWPRRIAIEILNRCLKYSFNAWTTSVLNELGRNIR